MANKYDNSIVFDGSTTDVTVTGYTVPLSAFTVTFWYKPVAVLASTRILDQQDSGPLNGFTLQHLNANDPNVQFVIKNSGSTVAAITSTNMTMGEWHFIALVYTVNFVQLFVDGVQQGTTDTNATMTQSTNVMVMGKRSGAATNRAKGNMCDLKVFSKVLRDSDIKNLQFNRNPRERNALDLQLKCDEGSGLTVTDTSGRGKNALGTAITWSSDVPYGLRNRVRETRNFPHLTPSTYLQFNGTTDVVSLATAAVVPDAQATISMSVWALLSGSTGRTIVGNKRDGTTSGWMFDVAQFAQDKLEFTMYNAAGSSRGWISNITVPYGQWVHLGVTMDGTTCRFYIGGREDTKETLGAAVTIKQNASDNVQIGHRIAAGAGFEFWQTALSRLALYSRVLTNQEMTNIAMGLAVPSDSMLGYWKMDEGTGTTLTDSSSAGNNGTLTGCTWVNL